MYSASQRFRYWVFKKPISFLFPKYWLGGSKTIRKISRASTGSVSGFLLCFPSWLGYYVPIMVGLTAGNSSPSSISSCTPFLCNEQSSFSWVLNASNSSLTGKTTPANPQLSRHCCCYEWILGWLFNFKLACLFVRVSTLCLQPLQVALICVAIQQGQKQEDSVSTV